MGDGGGREGTALGLYRELRRQDRFEGCGNWQPWQGCADGIPEASVLYVLLRERPWHRQYHQTPCPSPALLPRSALQQQDPSPLPVGSSLAVVSPAHSAGVPWWWWANRRPCGTRGSGLDSHQNTLSNPAAAQYSPRVGVTSRMKTSAAPAQPCSVSTRYPLTRMHPQTGSLQLAGS